MRFRTLGGITDAGEAVVVGATVVVRGGGGGDGSGEGTVVEVLEELIDTVGEAAVTISIDDAALGRVWDDGRS